MKREKEFNFGKRAEQYDGGFEGRYSKKFYTALLSQIKPITAAKVLDVGCGTGYLLKKISESYKITGSGIDVERKMIEVAKRQCPNMNIQVSACEKTPFEENTFDVMTACMAYHHFADKEGFAQEVSRILKNRGYLYIADPSFPLVVRKLLNHLLRLVKLTGEFLTLEELERRFNKYGFERTGAYKKGYVQVIELRKMADLQVNIFSDI